LSINVTIKGNKLWQSIYFTHIRRGLYDNVYNCIEKEKVDVNQRDDDTGNPPLVVAVEENQIEIVRLLLNHSADANCKDWTSKNTTARCN
jgi:ankyrin repeat protein